MHDVVELILWACTFFHLEIAECTISWDPVTYDFGIDCNDWQKEVLEALPILDHLVKITVKKGS